MLRHSNKQGESEREETERSQSQDGRCEWANCFVTVTHPVLFVPLSNLSLSLVNLFSKKRLSCTTKTAFKMLKNIILLMQFKLSLIAVNDENSEINRDYKKYHLKIITQVKFYKLDLEVLGSTGSTFCCPRVQFGQLSQIQIE